MTILYYIMPRRLRFEPRRVCRRQLGLVSASFWYIAWSCSWHIVFPNCQTEPCEPWSFCGSAAGRARLFNWPTMGMFSQMEKVISPPGCPASFGSQAENLRGRSLFDLILSPATMAHLEDIAWLLCNLYNLVIWVWTKKYGFILRPSRINACNPLQLPKMISPSKYPKLYLKVQDRTVRPLC